MSQSSMPQTGTSFARWLEEDDLDEEEPGQGFFNRRRIVLIGLIALLILALVGGGLLLSGHVFSSPPIQYQYTSTSTGNLTVSVSASGPIASTAVYDLNFPSAGTLTELDVSVGQVVKAGQVLAKINPTSLQDAENQAQAQVNSAWTNYQSAVLNLQNVTAQNDPCPTTATPPATAKTQQQCTLAIDQAQNQANSAWDSYQSALANLQTAKDNLGNAVMTAPAAGTIVSINGSLGEQVGSGGSGGSGSGSSSAFIVLENLSQLAITGQVNEADIGTVKVGQSASFTVPAYPSNTFFGTVTSVSPLGQTSSGVVTYPVTVSVDSHSLSGVNLLPGMTASLEITTQERIGVTLVPNKALTFARTLLSTGQISRSQVQALLAAAIQQAGSSAGTASFVVEMQNGKLTPRVIFTGLTNGTNTEVLSGLQSGEQVADGETGGTLTPTTTTGGGGGGGGGGIFGGGGGGGGGGGRGGAGG
ncbi:MAG TPA: efflux RND transporter periplasmic adaptor subunit [Ktedonobacterales bacterium]|nr:efflux RND transporter periplasmic adaptor subunit [Ktedonobacterales bacterium]